MNLFLRAPLILVSLIVVVFSCQRQNLEPVVLSQKHLLQSTLFVQHAAEYDALCFQAYEIAKQRILTTHQNMPQKAAIVLDLDETVLDNSPYTGWQLQANAPYTPETWAAWVNLAEAEAVPGALDFLNLADSLGFALFYLSNRDAGQIDATMKNLQSLGVPQAVEGQVLLKEDTGNKDTRRELVRKQGYKITMLIGDNLGDFSSKWDKPTSAKQRKIDAREERKKFGANYIILPNPVYGTWEGALNGYNRNLSPLSADSLRMDRIKAVDLKM